jgi:carboxyl-terminal processing protease
MKPMRSSWISFLLIAVLIGGALIWTNVAGSDDMFASVQDGLIPLAKVFQEVNRRYVDKVDAEKFLKSGIDGMLETLDPYTNYIEKNDKDQLEIAMQGKYEGVGLVLMYRNNVVTVADPPFLGTPAARAGIREGDQIIRVNGIPAKDLGFEKTVQKIRGLKGTEVVLTIQREGETKGLDFTLIREQIKVDDVSYSGMIKKDVGYILLTRFSRNAGSEVAEAIQKLKRQNCTSLILDLRSNPGGMLEAAVEVSEMFLPKQSLIVSKRGRASEEDQVFKSVREPIFGNGRLVVLVNGASASASEIVAGAIQDHDRGVILGDTTYGKGLVQTVVSLTPTASLKITTAKYYTPSGRCIQKKNYSQWEDTTEINKSVVFKTDRGRSVFAGGGIVPDIVVREPEANDLYFDLVRKSMFFNFAVQYANTHAKPDSNFHVTGDIVQDFRKYLKQKSYEYKHPIEKSLSALKNEAIAGAYQTDLLKDIQRLEQSLGRTKEDMLVNSMKDVNRALKLELISKFFGARAQIESSQEDDAVFQKCLSLLGDQEQYQNLLNGKNR